METMKNNAGNELKNPFNFKVGTDGILLRKDSRFESGELFEFTLTNFKKLRAKDGVQYRAEADLIVKVGDKEPMTFKKVSVSSLLTYKILQNMDKYVDVKFKSYSTTPDYVSNPLRLVKCKDGSYMVCNVTEGGVEMYTVILPGGEEMVKQRFVTIAKEKYFRYYEAKQETQQ